MRTTSVGGILTVEILSFKVNFSQVRKDFKGVRRGPCGYVGDSRQMKQPVQRPRGGNSKGTIVARQNGGVGE